MRRGFALILCLALLLCCLPCSLAGATEVDSAPLTRAQAAEMLQSALEVLDFREEIW